MELYELPNSAWVNPKAVTSIVPLPRRVDEITGMFPPRVVVSAGPQIIVINYESDDEAVLAANTIAGEINEMLSRDLTS